MTEAMHSFPGIASLWLHLRLSNDLARFTACWRNLPWIYSSWMQHCVITDVPLGQMRYMVLQGLVTLPTHSFLPIRRARTPFAREVRVSAILRSRTSQSPLWVKKSSQVK
jgi:hypothetical protein